MTFPEIDDEVVVAALVVLAEHGMAGLTLERLAEVAGRSRTTLFRRGVTVDGVLTAIAAIVEERYRAALWPALTGPGTGRERLVEALDALVELLEEYRDALAGLGGGPDPLFHRNDDPDGAVRVRDVYAAPLARLISDGRADGSLRADLDADEVAELLFNIVPRIYLHLRTAHEWSRDRARDGFVDLLFGGLDPR